MTAVCETTQVIPSSFFVSVFVVVIRIVHAYKYFNIISDFFLLELHLRCYTNMDMRSQTECFYPYA